MAVIDVTVKKDPIKPEKKMICDMETFSTVYSAEIRHYSQLKDCAESFVVDCGMFYLAGHEWNIHYYPCYSDLVDYMALCIRLCTNTTTSLKLDIQISLIDSSGRRKVVTDINNATYFRRNDGDQIKIMRKNKLEYSKYVKDDCLSFECIVTARKWSPVT
ncbi:BTB/POZ and MATH domain-containing protein 3-like [Carex rostrata]